MNVLMNWLRRVADAVSHADLGPYAGAPRNPPLRIGDEANYSTVRYTAEHVAHTVASAEPGRCPRCGRPLAETHALHHRSDDATGVRLGAVRTCRGCEPESWLTRSQMSAAARRRERARRHIV